MKQPGLQAGLAFCLHRVKQPTLILDPDFNIIYHNRAAQRNYGKDITKWSDTNIPIEASEFEKIRRQRQEALREHVKEVDRAGDPSDDMYEDVEEPEAVEEASKAFLERGNQAYLVEVFDGVGEYRRQTLFSVIFWHVDIISDYKSLFDNLPVMVAQETKIDRYANEDFKRFTGLSPTEVDFMKTVHADDRPQVVEALFRKTRSLETPADSEVLTGWQRSERAHRMRTADGSYRWVKTSAMTDGARCTYLSIDTHDLWTQAINLRKQEAHLQEENKRLITEESQAVEMSATKSAALATTAHEQRTYATGVIGMVDLLLDSGLDAEQRQYANAIRSSADGLLKIISDVLDISRLEAGKLLIEHVPFNLNRVISDLETLLRFMTSKKGLELKMDIEAGEYNILGDPGRVRQILINLLTNSIKFTPKGSVTLRLQKLEEDDKTVKVRFTVTDTGAGMSQATLDSLFGRFAQGEAGRRFGGTGLGLSICKQLLDLMQGEIGCETEEKKGTTFWFWLRFDKTTRATVRAATTGNDGSAGTSTSLADSDVSEASSHEARQTAFEALERTRKSKTGHLSERVESVQPPRDRRTAAQSSPSQASDGSNAQQPDSDEYDHAEDWPPQIESNKAFVNPPRGDSNDPSYSSAQKHSNSGPSASLTESGNSDEPVGEPSGPPQSMSSVIASETGKSRRRPISAESSIQTMDTKDKHILLVEDNAIVSKITTNMLRKLGYTSTAVTDGQSAVDLVAESSSFDLILMDKEMPPGIDGLEATRRIRKSANAAMRDVPIIALTASAMTGEREKCMGASMNDFLVKPVDPRKLERKLQRWLFR